MQMYLTFCTNVIVSVYGITIYMFTSMGKEKRMQKFLQNLGRLCKMNAFFKAFIALIQVID